jgi:hypothetical protein
MRKARLEGLHAAAIAGVGSLVLYLPVYAALAGTALFKAPVFDVALQAIVQGLLTAIVALLLYGRMVSILGATGGAALVALRRRPHSWRFQSWANGHRPSTAWLSRSSQSVFTPSVADRCLHDVFEI